MCIIRYCTSLLVHPASVLLAAAQCCGVCSEVVPAVVRGSAHQTQLPGAEESSYCTAGCLEGLESALRAGGQGY